MAQKRDEEKEIMERIARNRAEDSGLAMIMGVGGYLIGRLEGGNKLIKPRICEITDKKEIHMRPVLGLPPFIVLNDYLASYKVPVREDVIIKLYNQVTDPKVDPGV